MQVDSSNVNRDVNRDAAGNYNSNAGAYNNHTHAGLGAGAYNGNAAYGAQQYPVGAYSEIPGNKSILSLVVMEIILFATLAASFVWIFSNTFMGGIDRSIVTPTFFNFHTFFTCIGVIFFLSQALLMYRYAPLATYDANNAVVDRERAFDVNMALQGSLQGMNWICCLIAIVMVGVWKDRVGGNDGAAFPVGYHYRTAHSWIGIVTMGISLIQMLAAFFTYIVPVVSYEWRLRSLPVHKWLGMISFLGFFLSMITGFNETGIPIQPYNSASLYFANALSIASMALAGGLLYILWPTWNYAGKASPADPVAHHAGAAVAPVANYNQGSYGAYNNAAAGVAPVQNVSVPVAAY